MASSMLARIFAAKASRVFASGLLSVITPVYLDLLGYSPIHIGIFVLVMVASGVFSNVMLSRYEGRFGRRFFILLFSGLMVGSGLLLFLTTSTALLLLAFFIGNISTTGTEAGPFQSIEAGVLPSLVPPARINRILGVYNVLGYGAASMGALSASIPGYLQNSLEVFRLLYLVYAAIGLTLLVLYLRLGDIESPEEGPGKEGRELPGKAKRDITRISALYSVDAFGGSLVSQSLLAYWFYLIYHVSLADLGIIFFVVNVAAAVSIFAASLIAERYGNLRTMVSTHLISNVFLTAIPFAGSLTFALLLLFLRQSLSQMDVPTRQAFMADLFDNRGLVKANATTNTFRSVGSLFGGPVSGLLYAAGLASLPMFTAGVAKILYDLAIYSSYRREVR
jgi:predicted MFS family arabinose efflux permease